MNSEAYCSLIEDTLTYLKGLLCRELPLTSPPLFSKKELATTVAPSPPLSPIFPPVKDDGTETLTTVAVALPPPSSPPAPKVATDTLKKLLLNIDPTLHLHENPPNDAFARQIKNGWKREVPAIPIFVQGGSYRSFLINVAQAIHVIFAPSYVVDVEREENWDLFLQSSNLKCIISPHPLIFSTKALLPFYREYPNKKVRYLGGIPLLLLPDLSLYHKSPYLKRSLWKMITQNLQPLF